MKTNVNILSTLLLAIPTVFSADLLITNQCSSTIYVKPDANGYDAPITALSPGADVKWNFESERFGNSVKFSRSTNFDKPISFDYTVSNGITYYDISDAAGSPFALWAIDRRADGGTDCSPVGCPDLRCKNIQGCPADRGFQIIACS